MAKKKTNDGIQTTKSEDKSITKKGKDGSLLDKKSIDGDLINKKKSVSKKK
jgi:hypothetical protein